MKKDAFYHALKVVSTACTGCTHCMHVCPTSAIRIKHGKAVLPHLDIAVHRFLKILVIKHGIAV